VVGPRGRHQIRADLLLSDSAGDGIARVSGTLRLLNRIGALFPSHPSLEPDELMDAARKKTGRDDFGDPDMMLGLAELVDAYRREDRGPLLSRVFFRSFLLELLTARLDIIADLARRPEILSRPLPPTLMVVGLPRTGTTLLHRLLSLDPLSRAPRLWELTHPSPPPRPRDADSDPRIAATERRNRGMARFAPGMKRRHEVGARQADECVLLMARAFFAPLFHTSHHVPTYAARLLERDPAPAYHFYHQQLQHLSAAYPDHRLTLKNVLHTPFLTALTDEIPELMLVCCHRDPLEVVPSFASLVRLTRSMSTRIPSPEEIGEDWLPFLAEMADRLMRFRHRRPEACLDIGYKRLIADPIAAVRAVYDHYALPWPDGFETILAKHIAENPQHKHGVHHYRPEWFGLSDAQIRERFQTYTEKHAALL